MLFQDDSRKIKTMQTLVGRFSRRPKKIKSENRSKRVCLSRISLIAVSFALIFQIFSPFLPQAFALTFSDLLNDTNNCRSLTKADAQAIGLSGVSRVCNGVIGADGVNALFSESSENDRPNPQPSGEGGPTNVTPKEKVNQWVSESLGSNNLQTAIDNIINNVNSEGITNDEARQLILDNRTSFIGVLNNRDALRDTISDTTINNFIQLVETYLPEGTEGREELLNAAAAAQTANTELEEEQACVDSGGTWDGTTCTQTTTPTTDTCRAEGIGWILCPVATALGSIGDTLYNMVEGMLMNRTAVLTDDTVFSKYVEFLGYANILLGIFFLIIIIGTMFGDNSGNFLTSFNYKKALPKLIMFAILVNVAFYICAALFDISNIIGNNVSSILNANIQPITLTATDTATNTPVSTTLGGGDSAWAVALGWIASGFTLGAVGAGLFFFAPGAISSLLMMAVIAVLGFILAIFIAFLCLMIRQAALLLFVIISPVAFALAVLPNTEKYFKSWWGMFIKLLFFYPFVAAVFFGTKMAAGILANIPGMGFFWQLMCVVLTAAPLFFLPKLFQGAVAGLGKLGGNITSKLSGMSGAITGAANKKWQDSDMRKRGIDARRNLDIQRRDAWIQNKGKGLKRFGAYFGSARRGRAAIQTAEFKQRSDYEEYNTKAADAWAKNYRWKDGSSLSDDEKNLLALGENVEHGKQKINGRTALNDAQRMAVARASRPVITYDKESNEFGEDPLNMLSMFAESDANGGSQIKRNYGAEFASANVDVIPWAAAGPQLGAIQSGTYDDAKARAAFINQGLSEKKMATMKTNSLRYLYDHADDEQKAKIAAVASRLQNNAQLSSLMGEAGDEHKALISSMSGNSAASASSGTTNSVEGSSKPLEVHGGVNLEKVAKLNNQQLEQAHTKMSQKVSEGTASSQQYSAYQAINEEMGKRTNPNQPTPETEIKVDRPEYQQRPMDKENPEI